ncbi:MAG: phosphoheptose isomerase [Candidatus Coatesbacteria bacterium RBG_13_66_14]|uniref:Phosphoheptose isomerase n=1 Tax=Candidatus Coatesbacteria bacterium RBG_13_66_14 TaxID=1817816 RepID=A0A1F5F757_9BACT|nr:MAG: phosphoheptose isomerase [Candidatus Coatesbacteria bacterium RBG_13_66_14]
MGPDELAAHELRLAAENLAKVADELAGPVARAAEIIIEALQAGRKVLLCGNGGSAADAQHFAAELVGRFETERRPLPAVALSANTSNLTAIGNDYGFDEVFARQVDALGRARDVLVAISTSGGSPNVLSAVTAAREKKMKVVALAGRDGGKLAPLADAAVVVRGVRTCRIQEGHITCIHVICRLVDEAIQPDE